jgi:hypothetical protein
MRFNPEKDPCERLTTACLGLVCKILHFEKLGAFAGGLIGYSSVPQPYRLPMVSSLNYAETGARSAFFTEAKHDEFRNRVLRITSANSRQWATMSVAQMLHHLNLACGGSLGFYVLPDESYLVSRTVFRWILVEWFPEQPLGLRLPKGFKIPHIVQFDFDFEKQQLLKILDAAWHARSAADWGDHQNPGAVGRLT